MNACKWRTLLISTIVAQAAATPVLAVTPPPAAAPPEVVADWQAQDRIGPNRPHQEAISALLAELGPQPADLRAALAELNGAPAADPRWTELYLQACAQRRAVRLQTLLAKAPRIIFTKHYDLGGSFYAYTEGQSDAQNERSFVPGASLCLLTMDGPYGRVETLLDDPGGVIRDPDVSYDGARVLLAWKKSLDGDDFHLYELDMPTRQLRQLTSGLGFADYEGVYAPSGDILFNSTRCVQTVDCWWTEVSNLYTCDRDGRFLRRLSFDQVHTNHPAVTPDGRVLYTRWDYNDRGQVFPQGLFQMLPDGTGQTEAYGNNSWFPTSILHARAIPDCGQIVAIFSGHHTLQKGWLGILDPAQGRQENTGAQLIAPIRKTDPVHVDSYGQDGDQFQYPYPLGQTEFIVAFKPAGSAAPFAIYWIDVNGRRELLAWDAKISCSQPVPLAPRPTPHVRPTVVDYRQTEGLYYVQDVYAGPGLTGVSRGTVKKLRVVALEFRAAGIGANCNEGPGGGALVCTPVSIGNGAWDPKTVLGEAQVYEDGSALFAVPARTPVYFQAIDERGYAVQTMRSWSTLQPGERAACVGCHESKNSAPPTYGKGPSLAMKAGVERLYGFYGPQRGFSFRREIQPILDRHCTRCHNVPLPDPWRSASDPQRREGEAPAEPPLSNPERQRVTQTEPERQRGAVATALPTDRLSEPERQRGEGEAPAEPPLSNPERQRVAQTEPERQRGAQNEPGAQATGIAADVAADPRVGRPTEPERQRGAVATALRTAPPSEPERQRGADDEGDRQPGAAIPHPSSLIPHPLPPATAVAVEPAFTLLADEVVDPSAQRKWTASYLALTHAAPQNPADRGSVLLGHSGELVNWISPQSAPPMLPPYSAGAAQSRLLTLLDQGHYGVQLSRAERDKLACWIDLLVPYCADYLEANAWSPEELARYQHFQAKRQRMEELEQRNIAEWIATQGQP